jgi:D-alanyl-D-alanine carboxypeptidase (penicillin-binding protein 5/6)
MGFRDFDNYVLFQEGDSAGEAEVWQGANGTVGLQIEEPLTVILRSEDRRDLKVTITYNGPIPAPITQGQQIAELRVSSPGAPDIVRPLVAAEDVAPMGIFGKIAAAAIHLVTERLSSSSVDSP